MQPIRGAGRHFAHLGLAALLALSFLTPAWAQTASLRKVPQRDLPARADGNSPAFWRQGRLSLFTSIGSPLVLSEAPDQFGPWESRVVEGSLKDHYPVWVEAAWLDSDGVLFAWYHHEPEDLCGSDSIITAPEIGAAVSFDGGKTMEDLGIILKSPEEVNCAALNGYFGGGHGDFSVVLDQDRQYFYFFFSNYGGAREEQGIAVARMAYEDRFFPTPAVWKFREGRWDEPGLGGHVTAVYPAAKSWEFSDATALWGPSVHWNTYLEKYVILMNHACCHEGWFQDGIYISYAGDLSDPYTWRQPTKLLDGESIGFRAGFYPQIMGLEQDETDSVGGWYSRLYIQGISRWEIIFSK